MSQQNIENQIVKMQFDNVSFEKNCKESMSTLDKLKQALKFDKVDMSPLQKDLDSLNTDKVEASCDSVIKKFSLWGTIADQVIRDITSKFVDMSEKMVKSFTVDQVMEGWSKYAEKTSAVQTIMANTVKYIGEGNKWKDQEEQMAAVTEQIEKMNWYTDETSYSLTDMTNNLGKFLAQGVELERATDAMMGISSWAAISGQKKQQAEMAMYNLSQALGAGAVKAIDWKSIENANMATEEFKQTVIDTAKELGVLDKETNKIFKQYITAKKYNGPAEVTTKNFRETLSSGWFNGEVLMTSLERYGGFATKINELYNTVNREGMVSTTSNLLKVLEGVKNGSSDINKEIERLAKNADMEVTDLKGLFEELAKPEYDLGRRAFAAAQEAKTFQEAIEATSDAVASEWMGIFEAIFGNYLEAKELWTGLSNSLWDIFAGPLDNIKWALKEWNQTETSVIDEQGKLQKWNGRKVLLESICLIINNIGEAIEVVRSALAEVFPIFSVFVTEGEDAFDTTEASKSIMQFTKNLYEFAKSLKLSEDAASTLHDIVKLLATGVKIAFGTVSTFFSGIFKLVKPLFNIADAIFGVIGKIIQAITGNSSLSSFADNVGKGADKIKDKYLAIMDKVAEVLNKIADTIRGLPDLGIGKKIGEGFRTGKKYISDFWSSFKEMPVIQQMIYDFNKAVENIQKKFAPVGKTVRDTLGNIKLDFKTTFDWEKFNKILTSIYEKGKKVFSVLKEFAGKVKNFFKDLKEGKSLVDSFKDNFGSIIDKIKELKDTVVEFFEKLFEKGKELGVNFDLKSIQQAIHDFVANITPEQITMIAIAGTFMLIALNLLKLSNTLREAVDAFTGIGTAIKNVINSYIKKQKSSILQVAESIVIVAAALWVLSTVPAEKLEAAEAALITVTGLVATLTVILTACGIAMHKSGGKKSMVELASGLVMVSGAFMMSALTLKVLENVKLDGIVGKIATMAVIMVGLVGLSMLMGKLDKFKKGSLTMVACAGALFLAAKALESISEIPADKLEASMNSMFKLMIGLAAIVFASGKVGIFSAVGLIAIVLTFEKLLPAIEKIVNYDYSSINTGLQKNEEMLKKFAGVILIMTAIGMIAGNRIKGAGIAMLSIAATFAILVGIAKLAGKMRPSELRQGESFLIKMAGIIALIELCSAKSKVGMWGGKAGGEGSKAFTRIAVAMGILLGVAKLASMMDSKDLVKGELALAGLVGIIGLMVLVAKNAGKSEGVIKSVAAMIFAVSLVLAEVALLSMIPLGNMAPALGAILAIILSLAVLAKAISSGVVTNGIKKPNTGGIIALITSIISVFAIGFLVMKLSEQSPTNIAAAAGSLIAIVAAVALLTKTLSKISGKANWKMAQAAIEALVMVAVIGAVVGTLAMFMTANNISGDTMIKASASIAIALLAMVPVLAVLEKFDARKGSYDKMKVTVLGAIALLASVAIAIGLLSNFGGDGDTMIKASVAIAIGVLAMCAPLAVIGAVGTFAKKTNFKSMATIIGGAILTLASVATAIGLLSNFGNPDTMIQAAQALAIGLMAISVPIAVLGAVGTFCNNISGTGLAAMGISVGGAILALASVAGILIWFSSSIDTAQLDILNGAIPILATAIGGIAILALAIAAAGKLSGGNFAGVLSGGLAMVEAVGVFVLIVAALVILGAAMTEFKNAEKYLTKGLDVLVIIAGKLGEAAGALIGGFGLGLTSDLDKIADNMNVFADKMTKFSDTMAGFNQDAVTGCKNLAQAMLYITAAELLKGLTDWITFGFNDTDLDFATLGFAVAEFCKAIEGVDDKAITKASAASVIAKRLAEISDSFDKKGGLSGLIFGEKDSLVTFSEGIVAFGAAITNFCNSVGGLNDDSVNKAKLAADAAAPIIDLSKSINSSGGIIEKIAGRKDLQEFGEKMGNYATGLKLFVMRLLDVEKIDPAYGDLVQRCADASSPMVDLANSLQNIGGKISELVGDNTLSGFGDTLIPYANSLRIFVARLNSMASETPNYYSLICMATACTKELVNLANSLENMGGVKAFFSGDNTLREFGDRLVDFGSSLVTYSGYLGDADLGLIQNANGAIRELINLGRMASGISSESFNGLTQSLNQLSQIPITTITNEVVNGTPGLQAAYATMFQSLVNIVRSRAATDRPSYTYYATELVNAIKNGILRTISIATQAVTTLANNIKTTLSNNMQSYMFEVYGTRVSYGVSTGIYSASGAVISAAQTLINAAGGAISGNVQSNYDKAYEAGKNIAYGLRDGINAKADDAVNAAREMARRVNAALPKEFKERSPSRIAYGFGMNYDLGLANGITDYAGVAVNSTEEMADDIITTSNAIINAIAAALDANVDDSPVIKPVLDTSDIEYKAANISRLFNSADLALAYTASGTMKAIAPANVQNGPTNSEENESTSSGGTQINLTQNNYSPKALNRYEIYRQTNNQMRQLKEVLG